MGGKGNQLQERPLTDAIQCLKTPGAALPLMAALQHDDQRNRQKRARDFKRICQRLYKHSIKLMGSSCFISSARQVGKSNCSSCRRWVGREETEILPCVPLLSLFPAFPHLKQLSLSCGGRDRELTAPDSLIPKRAVLWSRG